MPEKAELFFRLHELQTCSWGVSKIGRVAQTIDSSSGMLYSEFDTSAQIPPFKRTQLLHHFPLTGRTRTLGRRASLRGHCRL